MTAEEFLEHAGCARYYTDKGKARRNRAARCYALYVRAYREQSLEKLVMLASVERCCQPIWTAARDRDAGRPMASVPELLEG